MAKKLKNLRVNKVDFVDEGANQKAHIKLFKRKEQGSLDAADPPKDDEALVDSIMGKLADRISGAFQKAKERVGKGDASSFKEAMGEEGREKILDEIWTVCYALQRSLGSIVSDKELDASGLLDMLNKSMDEFQESMNQYMPIWASGSPASVRKNFDAPDKTELPILLAVHENIGGLIEKAKEQEGGSEEMMKIDKSKMTPEERSVYEELIKKYAHDAGEEETPIEKKNCAGSGEDEEEIEDEEEGGKKRTAAKKSTGRTGGLEADEDVYKGLNPLVKAELEALKKFREDAETEKLMSVAKKYEIIGKKPEELAPILKTLKDTGGTAYNDMIGVLDSMVAAIDSSGVFGEIGKSHEGHPDIAQEEAVAKARVKAAEIRKSRPELTEAQALDEAFLENPELLEMLDK